ncbi:MAG: hypothetical protein ACOX1V_02415 [Candidatus Iainarchaeum sp.]|jgi:hypothetical protein
MTEVKVKIPAQTGAMIEIIGATVKEVKEQVSQVPDLFEGMESAFGTITVPTEQKEEIEISKNLPEDRPSIPTIPNEYKNSFSGSIVYLLENNDGKPKDVAWINEALKTNGVYKQMNSLTGMLTHLCKGNKINRYRQSSSDTWKYLAK